MAKPLFGRKARIYVSATDYASANATMLLATKDIDYQDEAEDMKATARDYTYAVHGQGGKDVSLAFRKICEVGAQGTDTGILQTSYDNGSDIYVQVLHDTKDQSSGAGRKFKGVVMKMTKSYPESGEAIYDVMIVPSDPAYPPASVSTPLS